MSPCRTAAAALLVLAGCGSPAGAPGDPGVGVAPLRVLVLSGGDWHEFDGNLARLVDGVDIEGGVHWTFLPLGEQDADGVPPERRRRRLETLDLPAETDVVLAYTQGELGLSTLAKERLLAFLRSGGGFVGLHSAADSHPGWDEYTRMLGGRFESHPPYGPVRVDVDARAHAVTAGLAPDWALEDEFYHLTDLHLDQATVLMTGESPGDGIRRPVTWVKPYGRGRVAYTILGHGPATHGDARYRQLVAQALVWAAGRAGG